MFGYNHSKSDRAVVVICGIVGIGGFVGSFWMDYSIAVGELIAAIPVSGWVLATNKKVK